MNTRKLLIGTIFVFLALFCSSAFAMSDETRSQFNAIMDMSLERLGQTSSKLLKVKHPDADWDSYKFPQYVYNDLETETAYKVAVKHHNLLGIVNVSDEDIVIPCYCTCDSFGHNNLLYCFYKNGNPDDGFDDHGSQCAVCIRQALLAFLWDDIGATHDEIMVGMKKKFAPLIEKYHQHEH